MTVPHRCRHRSANVGGGGLTLPLEKGDGFVFGDSTTFHVRAFRANHREGLTLGDRISTKITYKRIIPDGLIFGDTRNPRLVVSMLDGLVFGSVRDGVFRGVGFPEGITFGEDVEETTPLLVGKPIETLVLGDVASGKRTIGGIVSESIVFSDSKTSEALFNHSEGFTLGDTVTAVNKQVAIELLRFGDSVLAAAKGIGKVEGLSFGDSPHAIQRLSHTEGFLLGSRHRFVQHVEHTEGIVFRDELDHLIVTPLNETLKFSDEYSITIALNHDEGIDFGDDPLIGTEVISASLSEGFALGDLPEDFNAISFSEGARFGDYVSRYVPEVPVFIADSFAKNVGSMTGCAGHCILTEYGESDGLGMAESGLHLKTFNFNDATLQGWTYNYTGSYTDPVETNTGSGGFGDHNIRLKSFNSGEILKTEDIGTAGIFNYKVRCVSAPATLEVRVNGSLIRTISRPSIDPSYIQYSDTFTPEGTVEFKFSNPVGGDFRIDDIQIGSDISQYKTTPMPYYLGGKGNGTIANTGGDLIVNGRSGPGLEVMRVYWQQQDPNAGNPNVRLTGNWWAYLHFTTSMSETAGGAGFSLNNRYYGLRGTTRIVGAWTIQSNNVLSGSASYQRIVGSPAISPEVKIYIKGQNVNSKMMVEDVAAGLRYVVTGWGLSDQVWSNFGLVHKGDHGDTNFHKYWVLVSDYRPNGFPEF